MRSLLISLMVVAILYLGVSCRTSYGFVPTCMKWSAASTVELIEYIRTKDGHTPMTRAILRDAQVCAALRELSGG